jgi:putative endonuclease
VIRRRWFTVRVKDVVGEFGERLAAEHLRADGMQILDRRWRCALGEVDIVAVDGTCLVVCEVKTRRSVLAGLPVEAVTPRKLLRLRRLTGAWLAAQDEHWDDVRIDVVSVLVPRRGAPQVEHLAGVA